MDVLRSTTPRPPAFHSRADRRRSRRRAVPGIFVTLAGTKSLRPAFAGNAVDISDGGISLAMTPEVAVGSEVLVSFELGGTSYDRLPAVVLRQDREIGVGALVFRAWPESAQRSLRSFLRH